MSELLDKMTPAAGGKTVKDVMSNVHSALMKSESLFAKVLPELLPAKKFAYITYTYVRKNKHLWNCTPDSIVAAAMEAAQLGLDFSIRNECHMVPYSGSASFQMGYKGVAKLVLNHPHVQSLFYYAVREGDKFEVTLGAEPNVIHVPSFSDTPGDYVAFYAVAVDHKGNRIPEVMTVGEVEAWAKRYIKANNGPFSEVKTKGRKGENFEAYGLKTVLLRLCNRKLPMSSELSQAVDQELETEQSKIEQHIGDEDLWKSIKEEADAKLAGHLEEETR